MLDQKHDKLTQISHYTTISIQITEVETSQAQHLSILQWSGKGRKEGEDPGVFLTGNETYTNYLIMMRTLLIKSLGVYRCSKMAMQDGTLADVEGMENISKLPFYLSFK